MGRSLSSCFKIMYCARDSADKGDGSPPSESKTSPGKRVWSFQKRSLAHHVPSNYVISESMPTVNDKQDQGAAADVVISENASVSPKATVKEQIDESPALPSIGAPSMESKQFTDISADKVNYKIEEDVVVIVQASIRGYLAKRELKKFRNIVKLQASIRRYLVRREAVGTLRCILAIFKIQQIVRARLVIRSNEFTANEKLSEITSAEMVESSEIKQNRTTPIAIKKLASNSFANQLLASKLETRGIHISCNFLQPDSGWIWLERWTTLASSDQPKITSNLDDLVEEFNEDLNAHDVNNKFQDTPELVSSDPKPVHCASAAMPSEAEEDLITNRCEKTECEVPSSLQGQISNSIVHNHNLKSHDEESWPKENSESVHSQLSLIKEPDSDVELSSLSECTHENSTQMEAHVTQEMEVGQVVLESRKSRNPGFAAVQAKFEELSVASNSNKSLSNAFRDARSDSKSAHAGYKAEEGNEAKSVYSNIGDIRKEMNTASTPDRSESELSETTSKIIIGDTNVEINEFPCDSDALRSKNVARSVDAAAPVQAEQKSEGPIASNTPVVGPTKDLQIDRSSQEGSPMNLITVPESNVTPPSAIFMHAKATKAEYITSIRQKRFRIVGNSSSRDSKNDSGEQNSDDHLKRGIKSSKRRNSFSMVKSDHELQTNGVNFLPSYMKPTESAMAKVSASISQRSSPDMHEKDNNLKKRNSLPNGEGKQCSSPRMQRSTSQVQQNTKGNGIHSPQNSAEKRWLR